MTEKERIEGQSHRKEKRIKDSDAVIHTFTFTDVCFVGILSTQWGSLILTLQVPIVTNINFLLTISIDCQVQHL